jgi:hypothetical protein
MYRQITKIILLILIVSSSPFSSFAAGGVNTNVYPNYVYPYTNYDKSLLKPLDISLNADITKNRINVILLIDQEVDNIKNKMIEILKNTGDDYYLFNSEPFKSHKDVFNFWYYNQAIPNLTETESGNFEVFAKTNGFIFPTIIKLKLTNNAASETFTVENGRSNADFPTIEQSANFGPILSYDPGNVTLFYSSDPVQNVYSIDSRTLKHELGHSILKLSDEYNEAGQKTPRYGYPNCAETVEQAKLWWGDLIGKVDPEFYTFREELIKSRIKNAGYELINNELYEPQYTYDEVKQIEVKKMILISKNTILNEEDYRVTLDNQEGCWSETGVKLSYKPTKKSLMDSFSLLLGYVNTTFGNKILDAFNQSLQPIPVIENSKILDSNALSNANCKVVLINSKHILECDYFNQLSTLSDLTKLGYNLIKDDGSKSPNFDYRTEPAYPCTFANGVSVIHCTGIVVDNIDPNIRYSIGLSVDNNPILNNVLTANEMEYKKFGVLSHINAHDRNNLDELYFKITELISADELKPIAVEPLPVVVSKSNTNIINPSIIITPQYTVRTGGTEFKNANFIIFVIILLVLNYNKIKNKYYS